jgi:hypothetical protein
VSVIGFHCKADDKEEIPNFSPRTLTINRPVTPVCQKLGGFLGWSHPELRSGEQASVHEECSPFVLIK